MRFEKKAFIVIDADTYEDAIQAMREYVKAVNIGGGDCSLYTEDSPMENVDDEDLS